MDDDGDEQEEEESEKTGGDWVGKVDAGGGESACENHVAMTGQGEWWAYGRIEEEVEASEKGGWKVRVAESVRENCSVITEWKMIDR